MNKYLRWHCRAVHYLRRADDSFAFWLAVWILSWGAVTLMVAAVMWHP